MCKLIFFLQIRGENYILPVDIQSRAVKTKANLQKYAIHLDSVISEIAVAKVCDIHITPVHPLMHFLQVEIRGGTAQLAEK